MASTSIASSSVNWKRSSSNGTVSGPSTPVILGISIAAIVLVILAGVALGIALRRYYQRGKAHPRRQNRIRTDLERPDLYAGREKLRISAPVIDDDQKQKQLDDYTRRYGIYYPRFEHTHSTPSHDSTNSVAEGGEELEPIRESTAFLAAPSPPSTSNVTLPKLVIPQFQPLGVMDELEASTTTSLANDSACVGHKSTPSSAAEGSPTSAYSQASSGIETSALPPYSVPPPVPPIPDRWKSVATDNTSGITRANTRAIGLMLKERAKRQKPDATSLPSPVSPIERSGSIRPTTTPTTESDDKPPMRVRLAHQRNKIASAPRVESLLEVPGSAVSASTVCSFPAISWEFPAPPAPPTPTLLTTSILQSSTSRAHEVTPPPEQENPRNVSVQSCVDTSPLKIAKVQQPDLLENLSWAGVRLRDRSLEKGPDVSYSKTRFQSTYGEIEYGHS